MDTIEKKIGDYLVKFFPGVALAREADIFSLGFVNSMFALQLVNFLEHEFEIEIENEDLDLDNFRSIAAMTDFVRRKESSRKQAG